MKASVIRSYLEKFLREYLESDEPLEPDEDGDYCFRRGSAEILVSLIEEEQSVVSILSVLLRGVKKSQKLLEALNDTNADCPFAKVYWREEGVVLRLDLLAESLDDAQLRMACSLVSRLADELDTTLEKEFRGDLAFSDDSEEEAAKA
ncbi:MAG TPA: YbjN domain-containing protein [Vicinamibacterales bacterium]|nr:YbjN domain-containing protein [Acidobacteriota bacterium]HOC19054.1 YbjN domain-containing protein [Vicinamibacterales bacterium]